MVRIKRDQLTKQNYVSFSMHLLRCLTRWRNFIELNSEKEEIKTVNKASNWLMANLIVAEQLIIATCGIECIQGQAVKNRVSNQEYFTTIIYCEKFFEAT